MNAHQRRVYRRKADRFWMTLVPADLRVAFVKVTDIAPGKKLFTGEIGTYIGLTIHEARPPASERRADATRRVPSGEA